MSEFDSAHRTLSAWINYSSEWEVNYNLPDMDIEYFSNGKSFGKPFQRLAAQGKCEYIKQP